MSSAQFSADFCPNFFANNWIQENLVTILLLLATLTSSVYLTLWSVARIKRRFMVSLQICGRSCCRETGNQTIYNCLLQWIAKNPNCAEFQDHMLLSKKVPLTDDLPEPGITQNGFNPEFDFDGLLDSRLSSSPNNWRYHFAKTVGFGETSSFLYKNARIEINRKVQDPRTEVVTLSTFSWNRALLLEIIQESSPVPKKDDKTKQLIYQWSGHWNQMGTGKMKRPLESLILQEKILPSLLKDIRTFLKMENWYVEKGIPYRRGYLLHGPPGCGKSSLVKALSGELGYNICVVSLSQKLTDDSVTKLLNEASAKSVILLEEIDAAFASREEKVGDGGESKSNLAFGGRSDSLLTFRGLLNALDGVASSDDGQIVFFTTNYPERLDPALIRPGRVDRKIRIDYPDEPQVGGMFDKFYDANDVKWSGVREKFVQVVGSMKVKVSLAMIQGLLFMHRDDPREAVEKAEEYFEEQFGNSRST